MASVRAPLTLKPNAKLQAAVKFDPGPLGKPLAAKVELTAVDAK